METLPGTSLNVDVTKFMGEDMEEEVLKLQTDLQNNDHVILKMLEEGCHADITLTARGGSVKAHRSVLSIASPVFKAMFEHNMKEQLSSTVHIPDMTIQGLQLFLLVLYITDEYTKPKWTYFLEPMLPLFSFGIDKHFDEFFRGFSKYQAFRRRLEPHLKDALERNLTPDNCWEYYNISMQLIEKSSSSSVRDNIVTEKSCSSIVRDYIVDNFHTVVQSATFLLEMRRDPDRVYSILIEADRESHLLIEALSTPECVQRSARRKRASKLR